jgi:two-component system, OmpR family, sensor histidine kinase VicK
VGGALADDSPYAILKLVGALTEDGIFIYNFNEKHLEYVNHAMIRIFDISHESFHHQPDFFINHIIREDVDHLLDEFEKLKLQSAVENVEFRLKSHDQGLKTITCNAYSIDGRAYCFLRDITKQRQNETYIVSYGAKKDALLDIISHNLAGPLNLTRSILDSLSEMVSDENRKLQKHIEIVKDTTSRCIDIVNDFLEEEHLVSEHISVKRTRFDAIEKINNIMEGMRNSYTKKRFVLSSNVNCLYVNNDEVKFMQIIQNLLSNAIKFSSATGRIEVIAQQMANSYSISVKDNGIGIPEHLQSVMFEKYTPAGREGLRGEKSLGMGLYIVKKLVSIMNGRLTFESKEGEGSIFIVQFLSD